jgi:hypothetical protein
MNPIRDHMPRIPKNDDLEKLVAPIIASLSKDCDYARRMFNELKDDAKAYLLDHYFWAKTELRGYGF